MFFAIRDGFRAAGRNWGLALALLFVNVSLAALLAAPLAGVLEGDLESKDAAAHMLYGFDYAWWSRWSDAQSGWAKSFSPDSFGTGFAFKNLDLLLKGQLPAGLFAERKEPEEGEKSEPGLDGVVLALGALYLLVQTFLTGGILGVLRAPEAGWTVRGLLHGSGFYFGRLFRIALLALLASWLLFRLNAPFARWADRQALECVSEPGALAWSFSRHALLLLALLSLNMVSSYAKVITVVEERSSAVLSVLSSLAFCLGNLRRSAGHYLAVAALLPAVLLGLWGALDGAWQTSGYKTQLVTLLLAQGLVVGRIFLRLALLGGMVALFRGGER